MDLKSQLLELFAERGPQGVPFANGKPSIYTSLEQSVASELYAWREVPASDAEVEIALSELEQAGEIIIISKEGIRLVACLNEQMADVRQALSSQAADPVQDAKLSFLIRKAWRLIWSAQGGRYFEGALGKFLMQELSVDMARARLVIAHLTENGSIKMESGPPRPIYKLRPPP